MEKKKKTKENNVWAPVRSWQTDGLHLNCNHGLFMEKKKKKDISTWLHMSAVGLRHDELRSSFASAPSNSLSSKKKKSPDGRTTFTDRLPPTGEWSKTFFFFVFIHQTSEWAGIWNASIINRETGPTEQQNRCSQIYRRSVLVLILLGCTADVSSKMCGGVTAERGFRSADVTPTPDLGYTHLKGPFV